MKKENKNGFFCVIYFINEKKTAYYHKVYNPSKLADFYREKWLWIKIYLDKQDYYSNPKGNNYYAIFDKTNPVTNFTFQPYFKK